MPTVVVIQDLDDTLGIGALWGEVRSNLHKALGAQGGVTSGSIRDLDGSRQAFSPLPGWSTRAMRMGTWLPMGRR